MFRGLYLSVVIGLSTILVVLNTNLNEGDRALEGEGASFNRFYGIDALATRGFTRKDITFERGMGVLIARYEVGLLGGFW